MSETLKITCPQCKSVLTIPNTPGVEKKVLTCPVCKYKATVSSYVNTALNVRVPDSDAPTEVSDPIQERQEAFRGAAHKPGFLMINGQSHELREGANTIGRRARTGTASIQVAGDGYMSRLQGTFYAKRTPQGYCYRYEELKAANHTTIRGTVLNEGDVIAVNPGDVLVMGETSVQLCQAADDESTIIKR